MIFGKKKTVAMQEEIPEEEPEFILFQGAINGDNPNLKANARLVQAGLVRSKQMVTDALNRRAEMICLEPKGDAAVVRFYIDGIPYSGGRLAKPQALAITQMMKLLAGLNVQQRRKPQRGGIKADLSGVPYELSVQSTPLADGVERLVIRADNLKTKSNRPDDIGFSQDMKKKIRAHSAERSGAFLVCGTPNSGTTTTTLGVLRSVDSYQYSIFTLANMGSQDLTLFTQFEVEPDESFEDSVTRMLRREADVLFLNPINSLQDVQRIFSQQHRLAMITEFRCKDAAHGIIQLCKWLKNPKIVADGLKLIVSQKLIRKLCKNCRQAFRPHPQLMKKMGIPPEVKTMYRAGRPPANPDELEDYVPCAKCGETGFLGRIGIFEMLEMTDGMKEVLTTQPSVQAIRAQAKKEGMQSFQKEGVRLVAEGITSLEELQRTFKTR